MKFFCFYVLFLTASFSNAQFDKIAIPKKLSAPMIPSNKTEFKKPNVTPKIEFNKPPTQSTLFPDIKAPKDPVVNLVQKNNFKNPNDVILKRLNRPEDQEQPTVKGDNFLGNFNSGGKFIRIVCRDYGEVDGDRVRVYLNDQIVTNEIVLRDFFQEVKIDLLQGFNKIEFQALNQGLSGPNTAEFVVYNDVGGVISSNQWNLTTGAKARLIITKE